MKFILLTILFSYSFSFELLYDSMNINYIPLSVKSSAMGGVYRSANNEKHLNFSHLSKFGGIYTLDIIQYNNITFASHGVDNIPNTLEAWENINDNGPASHEIDYSKIGYFDIKDFNLIISKIIMNKYNISIKNTFSKSYNSNGIGFGLNILTTKRKIKKINYYLGLYDVISFKRWSTSNLEYYKPRFMFSLEYPINEGLFKNLNSLNIITLYIDDYTFKNHIIDYHIGSQINLMKNLNIFFGNSNYDQLTIGISLNNNFFNFDYSYIIPNNDLSFYYSHNVGIGINISALFQKGKFFYP